jgi:hypothetical protein
LLVEALLPPPDDKKLSNFAKEASAMEAFAKEAFAKEAVQLLISFCIKNYGTHAPTPRGHQSAKQLT